MAESSASLVNTSGATVNFWGLCAHSSVAKVGVEKLIAGLPELSKIANVRGETVRMWVRD